EGWAVPDAPNAAAYETPLCKEQLMRTVSQIINPGDQASQTQAANTNFVLVVLFGETKRATFLYVVTFIFFFLALAGNTLLIVLICVQPHLHTPMYFFISQLSLMDLMYISVTVPNMLVGHIAGNRAISP
ncbi:Olfactory Receptor 2T34, partial [Manis pentadactyla]